MVVLKGEMSRGLYKLAGNVQTSGAPGTTTVIDSSKRQVVRRKRVTFHSSAKSCNDLNESRNQKLSVSIFVKLEIVVNNKKQCQE